VGVKAGEGCIREATDGEGVFAYVGVAAREGEATRGMRTRIETSEGLDFCFCEGLRPHER
jgi:hypothetical protein